jgi:hypothetical protein
LLCDQSHLGLFVLLHVAASAAIIGRNAREFCCFNSSSSPCFTDEVSIEQARDRGFTSLGSNRKHKISQFWLYRKPRYIGLKPQEEFFVIYRFDSMYLEIPYYLAYSPMGLQYSVYITRSFHFGYAGTWAYTRVWASTKGPIRQIIRYGALEVNYHVIYTRVKLAAEAPKPASPSLLRLRLDSSSVQLLHI